MTVSDDATLRLWSADERKQISLMNLNIDAKGTKLPMEPVTNDLSQSARLRSIAVMCKEKHIAVGCKEGTLRIIDLK